MSKRISNIRGLIGKREKRVIVHIGQRGALFYYGKYKKRKYVSRTNDSIIRVR